MKTIGFFNVKGGVGKTSLVYHVSWMLSEIGVRSIAADLDPQANLTGMFLDEDRLEELWQSSPRPTIYGAVLPQFRGTGDVHPPTIEAISDNLGLIVGDLELSRFEDDLSGAWVKCYDGDDRSFRVMSAFARAFAVAGQAFDARVALVDVGPNLGALNRAVLLACDYVVVPLAPTSSPCRDCETWVRRCATGVGCGPSDAAAIQRGTSYCPKAAWRRQDIS